MSLLKKKKKIWNQDNLSHAILKQMLQVCKHSVILYYTQQFLQKVAFNRISYIFILKLTKFIY